MNTLLQDLRYGFRMMAKKPGFTLIAIITLALGIGANTAIFSVVNAVLLNSLPYLDSGQLVHIGNEWTGFEHSSISSPEYVDFREQNSVFEDLAAFGPRSLNMALDNGEPERVVGIGTTASLFSVLKVKPMLGRAFSLEEETVGNDRVAIISFGFWQRRFGGDPQIVGKTFRVEAEPFTVVGVMPQSFYFPDKEVEIWTPLGMSPARLQIRGLHNRQVVARMKPGVSLKQAQAHMHRIALRLQQEHPVQYPEGSGWDISVFSLTEHMVGGVRTALLILMGAVGFVLLIACANVANLLLARAAFREREMAIRSALGATRIRLIRQLLAESVLMSLAGGVLGLLLSWWGIDALTSLASSQIPRLDEIDIDLRILGFAFGLSLLTGLVFGLVPAFHISQSDVQRSLKDGGRGSSEVAGTRVRRFLVVTEIALAMTLLIGAGLLIRSFQRMSDVDPGFDPARIVTTRIPLSRVRYKEDHQAVSFYNRLLEELRSQPGVQSAGAISILPMSGSDEDWSFGIEGYTPPAEGLDPDEQVRLVTTGYFQTMGMPLLRGRLFESSDTEENQKVVIISQSLARKYLGEQDPLGKRIKLGSLRRVDRPWWTIVGVVGDIKHFGLDAETKPILYLAHAQRPDNYMTVIARATTDPVNLMGVIRNQVLAIDKDQPVYDIKTMENFIAQSMAQRRFNLWVLGAFAFMALALATVGIYSVISYLVSQRTQEIGIRVALGAQQSDILKLVIGHGLILAFAGIAIGLASSWWLTRLLSSLLFEVSATDWLTYLEVALLLAATALAACYVPARRAARVDPINALRYE